MFFNKSDYVFDIHGEDASSKNEKYCSAIDKREAEEREQEENRQKELKALDNQWISIVNDINLRLQKFVEILRGKDYQRLMNASIGTKATLLYEFMDQYDRPTAFKIREMADLISSTLPKLKELQDKGRK